MDSKVRSELVRHARAVGAKPFGDRGDGAFFLRLLRRPKSVAFVRNDLHRWLELDGVEPQEAIEIALACSEACANAVEHANNPWNPAFEVEARHADDMFELVVRDFGRWSAPADGTGTRGRGLAMIRAIMDEVDVASSGRGTEVVMRRSLSRVPRTDPRPKR